MVGTLTETEKMTIITDIKKLKERNLRIEDMTDEEYFHYLLVMTNFDIVKSNFVVGINRGTLNAARVNAEGKIEGYLY